MSAKKPTLQPVFFRLSMIILLLISLVSLPACEQSHNPSGNSLKAAIVDQLYILQPNEAFIHQVTQELEDYGFEVDIYRGDDVTVDLYRGLPGHGYKLIIFRAHSGLLAMESEVVKRTCLFTSERYSKTKYVAEQLSERLAMAKIDENHPWVFAIGDSFVAESMEGEFDNTVIIMMGCSCIYLNDLAEAFISKGSSAYLAWDASVNLDYVDEATVTLVENLCSEELTLKEVVDLTMATKGPDPVYLARLKYYPPQSAGKSLKQLV